MATPLWTPSPERCQASAMEAFRRAVEAKHGQSLPDYDALHAWSVAQPAEFWRSYADFAGLHMLRNAPQVMSDDPMPHTRWFDGVTLNYAEQMLFPADLEDDHADAIIAVTETGHNRRYNYQQLRQEVQRCAAALEAAGVGTGDRVAAYVGNVAETVVLMLACASRGAIFSSCSPDFGEKAALARFGQIEPSVLVASDSYFYGGKRFETVESVLQLSRDIPSVHTTVFIPYPGEAAVRSDVLIWQDWLEDAPKRPLHFEALPFDHPLYILYSSGTTGLPKAIVHRAGGALLSHHKEHRLHCDIRPDDSVLYFTTCGWMMWNWLVSVLAQGARIVLYEGSPSHPSLERLWQLVEELQLSFFGTSARFIHGCKDAGMRPSELADLSALRCIASTGSPLSPAGFAWVYEAVKADLHLASISGGTDIVSCFMLGNPTLPVYEGQIQSPGLGVDLVAYNDAGQAVSQEPGELICRQPLPSMPLKFWNDPDFSRYHGAYFDTFPGVWRHGDLIEITAQGGVIVYGRSDATLNPGGVRIGTAELYRPLEEMEEVLEAAAVSKRQDGDEVIWLFVVLRAGVNLDEALEKRIRSTLRQQASPRHVPKTILQVPALPRTRSGKMMEIAVARLINGQSVPNREVIANPEALDAIAEVVGIDA